MQPKSAGTNTRSAPRRHAPRRPCCSLCSARARSGLITTHPRVLPLGFGSVAPLLPAAPLFPAFGIAPPPVANSQPKRHHQPGDRRLGRRIQSTHPLQMMDPTGVAAVASSAREVRRAIISWGREAQYAHWQKRTVPRAFNCMARSRRQGRTPLHPRVSTLTALASPGGMALRKARSECACLSD